MRAEKTILNLPVWRTNPATGERETATYTVRPARLDRNETNEMVKVYEGRLDPKLEGRLAADADKLRAWLHCDPTSVLVGVINDQIVSLMRNVKWVSSQVPSTYNELTGNDTGSTSNPAEARLWICPWITTHPVYSLGWKGTLDSQEKSIAQLQVSAMLIAARQAAKNPKAVIAYSRPASLYQYLEENWGKNRISFNMPGRMTLDEEKNILTDQKGLYYRYGGHRVSIFDLMKYLNLRRGGVIADPVLRMHVKNGAKLLLELILANAQPWDGKSIFYRICLAYNLF